MTLRDCSDSATWWPHLDEATRAIGAGGLVVIPTDTVYGIAADAFRPEAVAALLKAKGRGRQMPPPVLIGDVRTMDGLADEVPEAVRELVAKFWPGPLTVILRAQPSLQWDLGDTQGTVALRMPDHELALALLVRTGPLAVSSANSTGSPAATTAEQALEMLGKSVRLYLDAGSSPGVVASTIIDATGPELRIVREGALTAADLGLGPKPKPKRTRKPVVRKSAAAQGAVDAVEGAGVSAAVDEIVVKPRRAPKTPAAAAATAKTGVAKPATTRRRAPKKPAVVSESAEAATGESTAEANPAASKPRTPRKPKTAAGAPRKSPAAVESPAEPGPTPTS